MSKGILKKMGSIDKCREFIENNLKKSRVNHTYGVCETAKALARAYGEDETKAETAAMFHDICKYLSVEESDRIVKSNSLSSELLNNTNLAHGHIAALMAERDFGVKDKDILNSIRYHTSARAGMSLLEKIIFVADACEPGRTYREAEALRERAFYDLEGVYEFILTWMMEDLESKGITPGSDTEEAYKEICDEQ